MITRSIYANTAKIYSLIKLLDLVNIAISDEDLIYVDIYKRSQGN